MNFDPKIQASLGDNKAFLQQLLQIPTERMREHQAVRFLAQALDRSGCEVEIFQGRGIGEPTPEGPPINIFARRKGTGRGKSLLLGAHLDTVPPGETKRWTHAPWSGDIVDGRIYARGAHDDRSGAALLWMTADLLEQAGVNTGGDLYFLITTEEEYSSGGMKAYLEKPDRVYPDAYLMVDGNFPGECILGHPGALSYEIAIRGPFQTAQEPSTVHEANAIELMGTLVKELRRYECQVRKTLERLGTDGRWPPATVAVSEITSCGWISNVPEVCLARGFCNVFPPLSLEQYKADFEAFVKEVSASCTWLRAHPPTISWGPLEVPSMVVPESSPFFLALAQAHQGAFGSPLKGRYIGGWGDPRLLECPETIFYGPGGGGGDHTYDEYYELKDLAPVLGTLVRLVVAWCGNGREPAGGI
jgi:acetylornithine deacetylase